MLVLAWESPNGLLVATLVSNGCMCMLQTCRVLCQLPYQTIHHVCVQMCSLCVCAVLSSLSLLTHTQERLAVSNRQLKQWHRVLAGKVAALMSTDLVRHKDK